MGTRGTPLTVVCKPGALVKCICDCDGGPKKGFSEPAPAWRPASQAISLHVLNPGGLHLEWELVLHHLTDKKIERMTCWYLAVLGLEPGSCS